MGQKADDSIVRVALPTYQGPALHICRFPVPAPNDMVDSIQVPFDESPPWLTGAFARLRMLLPQGMQAQKFFLLPQDIGAGINPLWIEDPDVPLLIPADEARDRRLRNEWRMKLLCTPSSIGCAYDFSVRQRVAWSVLCRAPVHQLIELLANLSVLVDRYGLDPRLQAHIVGKMDPPPLIRDRLRAEGGAGHLIYHPRGVLWILREMLAVSDEQRLGFATWTADAQDDASLLGRAWFNCLSADSAPAVDEILLACWMLHEDFHGADQQEPTVDRILGFITALGFRFHTGSPWLAMLERWLTIWSTKDDHPSVADSAAKPSQLRHAFASALHVSIEGWLAGVWLMCIRWWIASEIGSTTGPALTDPFECDVEGENVQLAEAFRTAFRTNCVATIEDLQGAVRKEIGAQYGGLGTLPQTDSLALRNRPVIELADGRLMPLTIQLTAERAVDLYKFVLPSEFGGVQPLLGFVGKMFEAYTLDLIERVTDRHVVVGADAIGNILGNTRHCDALIGYGHSYLAVEVSLMSLSRGIAAGDIESINDLAERYQAEADQAFSTIDRLRDVTNELNLPEPRSATVAVVTDTPVPHSPLFLRRLRERRPDRTSKFLCSVEEFEFALLLGATGWEAPGIFGRWQMDDNDAPFEAHLLRLARIHSPTAETSMQVDEAVRRFVSLVPRVGKAA
ncbi:MAG: hypothetical protein WD598_08255 [Acidimicrobiia bacterium]